MTCHFCEQRADNLIGFKKSENSYITLVAASYPSQAQTHLPVCDNHLKIAREYPTPDHIQLIVETKPTVWIITYEDFFYDNEESHFNSDTVRLDDKSADDMLRGARSMRATFDGWVMYDMYGPYENVFAAQSSYSWLWDC